RVNLFADATNDHQWIHVDTARAKQGPYGACVAHGFMTLALASHFLPEIYEVKFKYGVNYGLNRVRFPAPVKVGARIRGRADMIGVERMKDGGIQAEVRVTVEVEGEPKPACVADTLSRFYF
ncbi:MAG TPA: MaoC family dehydratase, partial [Nevskiaceae bacterium]|nr:MaoC family dehydratase [Nevskiaceae bacterium]